MVLTQAFSVWTRLLLCILQVTLARGEFQWRTDPWNECRGVESHCGSHASNVQTRDVWCEDSFGVTRLETRCKLASKPLGERPCFKVCAEHHSMFEWTLGPWGLCEVQATREGPSTAILECGPASLGLKHRTVTCVEKGTHYVQKSGETSVPDIICERFWQKPSIVRDCLINCSQDCVVSEFDRWSECTHSCGNATKTRTRRVLVLNNEHGAACPNLSETTTCSGLPPCPSGDNFEYTLKVDPWSGCMVTKASVDGEPPVGRMGRDLHCVRNDGEIVDISFCTPEDEELPETSQPCVPSSDCVLSEWSLWSPCPNVCQLPYGATPREIQKHRTRTVKKVPSGRGQLCDELVEYEPCYDADSTLHPGQHGLDCQRGDYVWYASEWSPCETHPSNSAPCGSGIQTRHSFCIRASDSAHLPMPSHLCDTQEFPDTFQPCAVPCPVDCVVSSWRPWDRCRANDCDSEPGQFKKAKGYRTRERHIVIPARQGGADCPHLYEFAPCMATPCYSWKVGRVGECRPSDAVQNCGEGMMTRDKQCLNFNLRPVEGRWCEALHGEPEWEVPCYHPCPNDCVVSEWGDWSPCSLTCTGKNQGGMQYREKVILAQPGEGGLPCPPESDLRETRKCNDHSCALFAWQTDPWGECTLGPGQRCGRGSQTRHVQCDRVMPRKDAPIQRCKPELEPPSERTCTVPCPVDCVMSGFTGWTECPTECDGSGSWLFAQVQSRYILQHPHHSGAVCPSGFDEQRICQGPESCHTYSWVPTTWGRECLLGDSQETGLDCGDGMYTRELNCQRGDGRLVEADLCLRYGPTQPATSEACNIPCADDCQFNPWSLWSQCLTCSSMQTRTRTLHGASETNPKCLNRDLYQTLENQTCSCPFYRPHYIGTKSECIISDPDQAPDGGEELDCGRGHQYQAVQCLNDNDVAVELSICAEEAAVKKQPCGLPCPTDCQIGDWGPWSSCVAQDQTSYIGMQTRRRELMPPQFGGRPCPLEATDSLSEVQMRPCLPPSPYDSVQWQVGDWGECVVSPFIAGGSACGQGMQQREVSCLQAGIGGFTTIVNTSLCHPDSQPESRQPCTKQCDGQCVVSEWTQWSGCPKNCSSDFFRRRSRDILRHASSENEGCPRLTESQQCRLGIHCFQYYWNTSRWGSCVLGESAQCGAGRRTRLLTCVTVTGAPVRTHLCEKYASNTGPTTTEQCAIPCPLDCRMSPWAEWSICPPACGTHRVQTRTRRVLQNPNERGRPCPEALVQSRPCEAVPCYTYRHTGWGPCIAQGECGFGVRRREVTCHQPNGAEVSFDLCLKFQSTLYHSNMNISQRGHEMLQRVQECQIPCPGECQRGDWSQWSDCYVHCANNRPVDTQGVQVRSRASLTQREDCPGDEWETRSCRGTTCYEFLWKMDAWSYGVRNVWCQRSDGITVTGGCSESIRPNSIAYCSEGCPVENSFCSENEICSCQKGFKPMYSQESGQLAECVMSDGADSGKDLIPLDPTKHPDRTSASGSDELGTEKFPMDFLTILVLGTTAAVVLVMVIVICAICCCCKKKKTSKKNDDKLPQPQYRDYGNNFWDDGAKMKYTGEIDL